VRFRGKLLVAASSVWPAAASCSQLWLTYPCCGQPVLTAWRVVCSLVSLHAWADMVRVGMHTTIDTDQHGQLLKTHREKGLSAVLPAGQTSCAALHSLRGRGGFGTTGSSGRAEAPATWLHPSLSPLIYKLQTFRFVTFLGRALHFFWCRLCVRACTLGKDGVMPRV
jgi:hypothetical protein